MKRILFLFSSDKELNAAFPDGAPDGALTGVTGVGLVDAAIGTAGLMRDLHPDAVAYLGTCGAHRSSDLVIGDIVVAATVCLSSGDVSRGEMRVPELLPSHVRSDEMLGYEIASCAETAAGRDVRPVSVSCTLGITEDDQLAVALSESSGADVENLEAFSVVRAAGTVPVAVVLGVTNFVGVNGGRDWQLNYTPIMRRLASCVRAALAD